MGPAMRWMLLLALVGTALAYRPEFHVNITEQGCPGRPSLTKPVFCYYEGRASVLDLEPCLCSHLVLTHAARFPKVSSRKTPVAPMTLHPALVRAARYLKERNPDLKVIGRISGNARTALLSGKGTEVAANVAMMVKRYGLHGIEVALEWEGSKMAGGAHGKQRLTAFVKGLRGALSIVSGYPRRSRRSYSVHEEVADDIPSPSWRSDRYVRYNSSAVGPETSASETRVQIEDRVVLVLQVPTSSSTLGKMFDLKPLSKYVPAEPGPPRAHLALLS